MGLVQVMRDAAWAAVPGAIAALAGSSATDAVAVAAVGTVAGLGLTLARELFWLRALTQPRRDLKWIQANAASSDDADRWSRQLHKAHRETLRARTEVERPPALPR